VESIQASIEWWELQLDEAIENYEALIDADAPEEEIEKSVGQMKRVLGRAEFEKNEMARLEREVNEWAVDSAFKGQFSVCRRKK